jgi:hypothetical protein
MDPEFVKEMRTALAAISTTLLAIQLNLSLMKRANGLRGMSLLPFILFDLH